MNRKLKIVFLIMISLIIAVISTCNFSVALKARKYTCYEVTVKPDVCVGRVIINGNLIPLERYQNDKIKIDNKKSCLYSEDVQKFKIITSSIDDVIINFDTSDFHNIDVVKDGVIQEMHDCLYMNYTNILQTIIESQTYFSLVFFFISFIISTFCIICLKNVIKKIKNLDELKWYDILLFTISVFTIYFMNFYIVLALLKFLIIIPIFFVMGGIVFYLRKSFKDNIHYAYLIISVFIGITLLYILPPFNIPDEYKHFVKSFEMSYGIVSDNGYVKLPVSVDNFAYKYTKDCHSYYTTYNGKNYLSDLFESGNYKNISENVESYTNTRYLSILPYLPSALIIGLLRIIGLSPLILVLAGKFINLLITIFICYYSIKNIPCLKKVIFIVATFPIFLQQSSAINMDFLTNSVIIAIVSYIFYLKFVTDTIKIKHIIIMGLLSLALAFCKFGYFPILLLVFLIPNSKFKNKRVAIIFKSLFLILPSLISYLNNMSLGIKKDNPYYNINYVLHNPLQSLKVIYNTFLWRIDLDLFRGMFDGFAVSTKWNSPFVLSICSIIYILLISVKNDGKFKLNKKEKGVLVLISLLIIGIVYAAMFFGWTKLGEEKIDGLQPRYFIPAIICIYIVLDNNLFNFNVKNKNYIYTILILVVSFLISWTIASGFYNVVLS